MKFFGVYLAVILAALGASGCAKDNLDPLHLVSTEEISVQKRQAGDTVKEKASDTTASTELVLESTKPAVQ